eukprot:3330096-Pyramimonas_sp.AAC.1
MVIAQHPTSYLRVVERRPQGDGHRSTPHVVRWCYSSVYFMPTDPQIEAGVLQFTKVGQFVGWKTNTPHGNLRTRINDLRANQGPVFYRAGVFQAVLRSEGVLRTSPELAAKLDAGETLLAGSKEEVALRAATVRGRAPHGH